MYRSLLTLLALCPAILIVGAGPATKPSATKPATTKPAAKDHVDIALRNVRWQALPDAVHRVYAGPDGRVWYELFCTESPEDSAELRKRVEREFNKPAPQLYGA